MRIVHVVRTENFAGVERYVTVLAVSQAAGGDDVLVVGGQPSAVVSELQGSGVAFIPAGSLAHVVGVLDSVRGAHVFHVHMTEAEGAALLAIRARHVPTVATRHFGAPRGKTLLGRLGRPLIQRRISAQIAVSRFVATRIDGPSTVVYPGVPVRPDVDPSTRARTILIAQRLEEEKRTAVGLEAFARSGLANDGWTLQIAGSGTRRQPLAAEAHRLGIAQQVTFLGFVADMDAVLSSCGLLMATPPAEHFGLTVLEAMSWGVPIVAAGAAGHLESAGSVSDVGLFKPDDAEAAATVMRRLVRDEGLRNQYGAALRDAQRQRFTLGAQAAGVKAVYRSVL